MIRDELTQKLAAIYRTMNEAVYKVTGTDRKGNSVSGTFKSQGEANSFARRVKANGGKAEVLRSMGEGSDGINWPNQRLQDAFHNAVRNFEHADDALDHLYGVANEDEITWLRNNGDDIVKAFIRYGLRESVSEAAKDDKSLKGADLVNALTTACMSSWYDLINKFNSRPDVYDVETDADKSDAFMVFVLNPGEDVRETAYENIQKATQTIAGNLNKLLGSDAFEARITRTAKTFETLVAYKKSKGGVLQCKTTSEGEITITMPEEPELHRAFSSMTNTPHAANMGELGFQTEPDVGNKQVASDEPVPEYDVGSDIDPDELDDMESDALNYDGDSEVDQMKRESVEIMVEAKIAGLGSTITITDFNDDGPSTFVLVDDANSSPQDGRISITSPLGNALTGKKKGDTVTVSAPGGSKEYKVVRVRGGNNVSEDYVQGSPVEVPCNFTIQNRQTNETATLALRENGKLKKIKKRVYAVGPNTVVGGIAIQDFIGKYRGDNVHSGGMTHEILSVTGLAESNEGGEEEAYPEYDDEHVHLLDKPIVKYVQSLHDKVKSAVVKEYKAEPTEDAYAIKARHAGSEEAVINSYLAELSRVFGTDFSSPQEKVVINDEVYMSLRFSATPIKDKNRNIKWFRVQFNSTIEPVEMWKQAFRDHARKITIDVPSSVSEGVFSDPKFSHGDQVWVKSEKSYGMVNSGVKTLLGWRYDVSVYFEGEGRYRSGAYDEKDLEHKHRRLARKRDEGLGEGVFSDPKFGSGTDVWVKPKKSYGTVIFEHRTLFGWKYTVAFDYDVPKLKYQTGRYDEKDLEHKEDHLARKRDEELGESSDDKKDDKKDDENYAVIRNKRSGRKTVVKKREGGVKNESAVEIDERTYKVYDKDGKKLGTVSGNGHNDCSRKANKKWPGRAYELRESVSVGGSIAAGDSTANPETTKDAVYAKKKKKKVQKRNEGYDLPKRGFTGGPFG